MKSNIQWTVAVVIFSIFVVLVRGQTNETTDNQPVCDFENDIFSGSGEPDDQILSLPECIPLTEEVMEDKIYSECHRFLGDRCYMHDSLDFDRAHNELVFFDAALRGSANKDINTACRDLIRAFVCNYYYLGCNPETRLAQGICAESCVEYAEVGDCAASFAWLSRFAARTQLVFVFTPQCDDPLWYIKLHDSSLENITLDSGHCLNLSEIIENPIIPTEEGETPTTPTESNVRLKSNAGSIVGITFGVIAIVLLIIGGLLLPLCLYIRRVKQQKRAITQNLMEHMSAERRSSMNNYGTNRRFTQRRGSVTSSEYDSVGKFKLTSEDIEHLSQELRNALIPFNQVKITGDLGEGAFGCVYKGILTRESDEGIEEIGVAIKTIKNNSAYNELKSFLEESSIMCSFSHPNVLGMEGICLDEESQSPYLILPFMKNGDLKSFLRKKRGVSISNLVDTNYPDGLSCDTLLGMCYQIACGMEYLASRKLVHRDLAARNCMIDYDNTVKVADFGLTRDTYQKDYYRQSSRGQVPVKWMAPESLVDRISNEKTDVWSFGVTCWEVFSLGRVPYPTISNSEIVDYLASGQRLSKPALCITRCYAMMQLCWKDDPDLRPSFEVIMEMMQAILLGDTTKSSSQTHHHSSKATDSYEEASSSLSSADDDESDDSLVFSNEATSFGCGSSSYRYTDMQFNRPKLSHESPKLSKHTPPVPSPLLVSVSSYDIPNSIPRESFLQNNLSIDSAASVYLEMVPTTPSRLATLTECESPES